MDDNSTGDSLAGGAQLTPADGGTAVAQDSLTLAELNQFLGKEFKDKDSALKAVKDTYSYVGKRKEDIAAEIANAQQAPSAQDPNLNSKVQKLEEELFYTQNPQFKGLKDLISTMGNDPAEVVETDAFKNVFEKVTVADEVEQKKSVVSSSPRLAQAKSTLDSAVEIANARNSTVEDVALELVRGINKEAQG